MDQETANLIREYLENHVNVIIWHNNETAGFWYWSVMVVETDFWLESFDNKDDAIKYCEEHELLIVDIVDDKVGD
jgi:beta-galactosidase GanA